MQQIIHAPPPAVHISGRVAMLSWTCQMSFEGNSAATCVLNLTLREVVSALFISIPDNCRMSFCLWCYVYVDVMNDRCEHRSITSKFVTPTAPSCIGGLPMCVLSYIFAWHRGSSGQRPWVRLLHSLVHCHLARLCEDLFSSGMRPWTV